MNHDKMMNTLFHASQSTEYPYEIRKVFEQAHSTILAQADKVSSLRDLVDGKTSIIEDLLVEHEP